MRLLNAKLAKKVQKYDKFVSNYPFILEIIKKREKIRFKFRIYYEISKKIAILQRSQSIYFLLKVYFHTYAYTNQLLFRYLSRLEN